MAFHPHLPGRRLRGMTLVEMMVVIGIGVVATSLALPAISALIGGMRHAESVVVAQAQMMEARAIAIDTSRAISVQPDPAPGGGSLIIRRHNSQTTCAGGVVQQQVALSNVELSQTGPNPCFLPSGRVEAAVVTTIDFGRGARVHVYPAGNMNWEGSAAAMKEGAASVRATTSDMGTAEGLAASGP